QLTAEERELAREIATLTRKLAPQLLDQPGVGPLAAAQLLLSWSHKGRIRSEAAFARLAGCAPIPASSGQTIRYRLDRSGDRGRGSVRAQRVPAARAHLVGASKATPVTALGNEARARAQRWWRRGRREPEPYPRRARPTRPKTDASRAPRSSRRTSDSVAGR